MSLIILHSGLNTSETNTTEHQFLSRKNQLRNKIQHLGIILLACRAYRWTKVFCQREHITSIRLGNVKQQKVSGGRRNN